MICLAGALRLCGYFLSLSRDYIATAPSRREPQGGRRTNWIVGGLAGDQWSPLQYNKDIVQFFCGPSGRPVPTVKSGLFGGKECVRENRQGFPARRVSVRERIKHLSQTSAEHAVFGASWAPPPYRLTSNIYRLTSKKDGFAEAKPSFCIM